MVPAGHHKQQYLGDTAEVAHHNAAKEVQETRHNLVAAGSSVPVDIAEEALHRVVEEAPEKHHTHQLRLDSAEAEDIVAAGFVEDTGPEVEGIVAAGFGEDTGPEVEDIVAAGFAEDTGPEVDRDSEEGIDLERGIGQLADRKDPHMGADLRMEAGRTSFTVAVGFGVNLLDDFCRNDTERRSGGRVCMLNRTLAKEGRKKLESRQADCTAPQQASRAQPLTVAQSLVFKITSSVHAKGQGGKEPRGQGAKEY